MARTGWQTSRDIGNRIEQRELRLQNARSIATDDELITQFLERRGATHCPPGHSDRYVLQAMRWTRKAARR
jgi:hypothetical protein